MAKIICESCDSSFKFEVVKDMKCCPVCGADFEFGNADDDKNIEQPLSFGNDVELGEFDSFDEEKIDCWWYEIIEPGEVWKGIKFTYGDISANCAKCGHFVGSMPYPVARTKDYLLIDSRFISRCGTCGNEMKNHILSKRPESWVDPRKKDMWEKDFKNIPKCPTCSSTNIKKISATSKVASVAMWGLLSRKVHKQWHCNVCGSEW